jgi:hypothetical protein
VQKEIGRKTGYDGERLKAKVVWTGNQPCLLPSRAGGKEARAGKNRLLFRNRTEEFTVHTDEETGDWLSRNFEKLAVQNSELLLLEDLKQSYEKSFSSPFGAFLRSAAWRTLRKKGLLLI